MITVLCGGVGAARMLAGIVQVHDAADVTAIVNTGDDLELFGLSISPDLDTIAYTLSGEQNIETGWGLRGETWHALEAVRAFGSETWFQLGDRDLGTHLYRSGRLREGATLAEVTAEIARRFEVGLQLLPVTNDRLRTIVTLESGEEVSFQEYFVKLQHDVSVIAVRFDGAERAAPAPGVIDALEAAETIVIAPSNPIVSIGPILAIDEVAELLERRRSDVVAVSPIVGGKALKGPADRLLTELGSEASVVGVARALAHVAATLVIDTVDAHLSARVEETGLACVVTETVMSTPERAAALGRAVLAARQ